MSIGEFSQPGGDDGSPLGWLPHERVDSQSIEEYRKMIETLAALERVYFLTQSAEAIFEKHSVANERDVALVEGNDATLQKKEKPSIDYYGKFSDTDNSQTYEYTLSLGASKGGHTFCWTPGDPNIVDERELLWVSEDGSFPIEASDLQKYFPDPEIQEPKAAEPSKLRSLLKRLNISRPE
jgi:hypothetical protein